MLIGKKREREMHCGNIFIASGVRVPKRKRINKIPPSLPFGFRREGRKTAPKVGEVKEEDHVAPDLLNLLDLSLRHAAQLALSIYDRQLYKQTLLFLLLT